MQCSWFRCLALSFSLLLVGCAGIGVAETSDPYVKLSDASSLFDQQGRPVIAERLIREAIEICEKNSDQECLAKAYGTYGFFFRARSIRVDWDKYYKNNGFLDKTATFENRYTKSVEYFEKARIIYTKLAHFDQLTNINLNMGFTFTLMGDVKSACRAFDHSSASNQENLRRNPKAKPILPQGFSSFDDYLALQRKQVGCA